MSINFIMRILITFIFFAISDSNRSLLYFIGALVILDVLDCSIWKIVINYDCKTHIYQKYDKIIDSISYVLFIIFLKYRFDNKTLLILITALIWRTIGVIKFYLTNENKYLHFYPDVFKEIVLVYALVPNYNILSIIPVIIMKFAYEQFHHRNKYKH